MDPQELKQTLIYDLQDLAEETDTLIEAHPTEALTGLRLTPPLLCINVSPKSRISSKPYVKGLLIICLPEIRRYAP